MVPFPQYIVVGGVIVVGIILLVFVVFAGGAIGLWWQSVLSKAPVSLLQIVFMRFRKVDPSIIVTNRITAGKAGIPITADQLEAHFLAGGRVGRVVSALIAADKAGIPLTFNRACAIDLAGRDVKDAVNTSVNPKVIEVPAHGGTASSIDGVAQNGIQLKVRARVTVRTNLDRLVGGATEETIIARVGQGIVSAIGAAKTHSEVLENPKLISKTVLDSGLDASTAFQILSIDIADVIVGENIGARLQTDQAEAQKLIAQAEAEQRRAMAIAREQEMKALVEENRAKVVLAEAEIPMAMAEAFRSGRLGIMDYYQMKNINADTAMRDSIAHEGKGKG